MEMKNDNRFESYLRGYNYQHGYNQPHALSQWNSAKGDVVAGLFCHFNQPSVRNSRNYFWGVGCCRHRSGIS